MGWEGNMRDTIQCIKENIKGYENGTVGYADCYSDLFDAITEVDYSFPHWYTEEQKEKEAEWFGYAGLYDRKNDCLTLPEPLPVDMDVNTEELKALVKRREQQISDLDMLYRRLTAVQSGGPAWFSIMENLNAFLADLREDGLDVGSSLLR